MKVYLIFKRILPDTCFYVNFREVSMDGEMCFPRPYSV